MYKLETQRLYRAIGPIVSQLIVHLDDVASYY
mgnify:CR=1 FL=1